MGLEGSRVEDGVLRVLWKAYFGGLLRLALSLGLFLEGVIPLVFVAHGDFCVISDAAYLRNVVIPPSRAFVKRSLVKVVVHMSVSSLLIGVACYFMEVLEHLLVISQPHTLLLLLLFGGFKNQPLLLQELRVYL